MRHSQEWLAASAEVVTTLLSSPSLPESLDPIERQVQALPGADLAVIFVPGRADGGLVTRPVPSSTPSSGSDLAEPRPTARLGARDLERGRAVA